MRTIDFIPHVLTALREAGRELTGSDLSEAVWGTSGRGNPKLTNGLFPYMVERGLLAVRTKGRAKYYSPGPKATTTL